MCTVVPLQTEYGFEKNEVKKRVVAIVIFGEEKC